MKPRLQITLSHKGFVIVCLPLFVELVFVAVLLLLLSRVDDQSNRQLHYQKVISQTAGIERAFERSGNALATYIVTGDGAYLKQYRTAIAEIAPALKALAKPAQSDRQLSEALENLPEKVQQTIKLFNQTASNLESSDAANSGQRARLYESLKASIEGVQQQLSELISREKNMVELSAQQQEAARQHIYGFVLIGTGLNILLALFMGHIFYTGITGRLRTLMDNTYRLSRAQTLNPPVIGYDEISHLDGVFHDMARALADAARKERAVIENALDVICSLDADGRFSAVSPASVEVWGYSPQELIGKNYIDLILSEDVQMTEQAVNAICQERSAEPFENRMRRKDGQLVYILWSAYWSPAEKSLFCVAHDITERKLAENLLRESEARVRSIIESMPVGLMIVNEEGIIEVINPHTEKMFGYRFDELCGKHVNMLLPKAQEFEQKQLREEGLDKLIGKVCELEGLRKSGEIFPVEFTLENYLTVDGQRFLANMLDASERHEIERIKREFVATVSHELRTPLTAIRGSLTLLTLGVLGEFPEQAQKVIKIAERNSLRLIDLINDLLDLEKMQTGKMEMTFSTTSLSHVFERSFETVRPFADGYGIVFEVENTDAQVVGDEERLVQVMVNLLSNAVKYSPRQSTVKVAVKTLDSQVKVSIIDRGRGVPVDLQDKVFDRFQQVDSSDATRKGGSGLGLAICKSIIEQHQGRIGVESCEGEGSCFWFEVPLAPKPAAAVQVPEPSETALLLENSRAEERA